MKSNLVKIFQTAARRFGYDVVPSWRLERLEQSQILSKLIESLDITQVLDIGANKGQFVEFLRNHVGYAAHIVSFEPIQENAKVLKAAAGDSKLWTICGFALGAEETQRDINVMKADVFSSFLNPSTEHTEEFLVHNTIDHVERVQVKRLDQTLASMSVDPESTAMLLKSDTQGFDMQVLDGAGDCLRSIRLVQVEVSIVGIYDKMPAMSAMLARMKDDGFSLVGLYPVSHTSELGVVEFDALFKNNRFQLG